MTVRFYIQMEPGFDASALWDRIARFRVNLTVLETNVWCYGVAEYADYEQIARQCRLAAPGKMEISLKEE